jgi:hypothetical protein
MNTRRDEHEPESDEEKISGRPGNRVNGEEQPPSGLRPGIGKDEKDETAGGVDKSL